MFLKQLNVKNAFGIFVAIITWLSLGIQFCITDISIIDYLSYFTTLCNLLVAISLSFSLLVPKNRFCTFFSSLSVQSAIALYIFIVSLVYNTVLRGIWLLTGWQYILDNMVHVVIPILYIIFWLLYRTKGTLKWSSAIHWIIFPVIYLSYSIIRGSFIQWYPYPFLNAIQYGYLKVFQNIAVLLLVFLVGGFTMILITRLIKYNT